MAGFIFLHHPQIFILLDFSMGLRRFFESARRVKADVFKTPAAIELPGLYAGKLLCKSGNRS
jgi:hypothetical protein